LTGELLAGRKKDIKSQNNFTYSKNKIKLSAMKILFLLITSIVLSASTTLKGTETIVIKTTIFCDHCSVCNTCGGKLEKDLGFNKGIKLVKLDEKAMTVTVTFNPKKTTAEEIRKTISNYGYDADDVKANPESYSKLDECCKKQ
jgi:copper chaperone CopZ